MVPLATSTEQKKIKIQNLTDRWCKKKIITKKKEYKDHVAPVITLEMCFLWKTGMRTGLSPVVTLSTISKDMH